MHLVLLVYGLFIYEMYKMARFFFFKKNKSLDTLHVLGADDKIEL